MTTTFTPNKVLALQGTGDNSGTWGSVLNTSVFSILDSNLGGQTSVTINSSDVTLTQTQANNLIQTLSGTLTGNRNLIFPASQGGFWIIENGTSGAFSVTVKNAGGTGVAAPQGYQSLIYLNGATNVAVLVASTSPVGFGNIASNTILGNNTGGSAAPTALTVAQVNTMLGSSFPSGGIIMWSSTTPPTGFLECNGSAISRTTFATLFGIMGIIFGSGDGSTTFNLPDMRGYFARGFDNGAGVDPGRTFGSTQASAFASHTHPASASVTDPQHSHTDVIGSGAGSSINPSAAPTTSASTQSAAYTTRSASTGISVSVTNTATGGTDTYPINLALMYIIKT